MSLWKVPDEQTRELMEDFYQRILAGEPRAEAMAAGAVGDEEEVSRSVLLGRVHLPGRSGAVADAGSLMLTNVVGDFYDLASWSLTLAATAS
jgi:hypothetical protein